VLIHKCKEYDALCFNPALMTDKFKSELIEFNKHFDEQHQLHLMNSGIAFKYNNQVMSVALIYNSQVIYCTNSPMIIMNQTMYKYIMLTYYAIVLDIIHQYITEHTFTQFNNDLYESNDSIEIEIPFEKMPEMNQQIIQEAMNVAANRIMSLSQNDQNDQMKIQPRLKGGSLNIMRIIGIVIVIIIIIIVMIIRYINIHNHDTICQ
jgi:hypothetical protein